MGVARGRDFPHRETAGLALYLFGSSYSLGYEVHRFRWKARPENQGKLHTVGLATHCIPVKARPGRQAQLDVAGYPALATIRLRRRAFLHRRYCIHPNYFGDLFTYGGWGLACGTQCAMSLSPVSLFYLTLFVAPNSDACDAAPPRMSNPRRSGHACKTGGHMLGRDGS